MKKKIKDRWVAALLSGEYEQGRRKLRTANKSFCCLGVLCDLAAKDGVGHWVSARDYGQWRYLDESEDALSALPYSVMVWAGMRSISGILPRDSKAEPGSLAYANDIGQPFEAIACAIEGCWEEL